MKRIARQVWRNYNGKIPLDVLGRSWEVWWVDGNKRNNKIENLICLPVEDLYKWYVERELYALAYRLADKHGLETGERVDLFVWNNERRLRDGVHPFQSEFVRKKGEMVIKDRVEKGIQGLQDELNLRAAHKAKREKYSSSDLSKQIRKGWKTYKRSNKGCERVRAGLAAAVMALKGTKWYHLPDGSSKRFFPDDVRIIEEGWLIGKKSKEEN